MRGTPKALIKFLLEQDENHTFTLDDNRNKDQNAYYWAVICVMAKALGVSIPRLHNIQLRKYSSVLTICGERQMVMVKITDEIEEAMMESTTIHPMPTQLTKIGTDGKSLYRCWYLLKPSREMSKKEFAALLEGTIQDAVEMGVRIPEKPNT